MAVPKSKGQNLGQFDGPFVSGTDCNQSLIVCDRLNCRIQVKKLDGEWAQYELPEGITYVIDILVVKQRLFVLWQETNENRICSTCNRAAH